MGGSNSETGSLASSFNSTIDHDHLRIYFENLGLRNAPAPVTPPTRPRNSQSSNGTNSLNNDCGTFLSFSSVKEDNEERDAINKAARSTPFNRLVSQEYNEFIPRTSLGGSTNNINSSSISSYLETRNHSGVMGGRRSGMNSNSHHHAETSLSRSFSQSDLLSLYLNMDQLIQSIDPYYQFNITGSNSNWFYSSVFESIVELMTDRDSSHLVTRMFDASTDIGLNAIMVQIYSKRELFLDSAFESIGSQSIQRLVRAVKKKAMCAGAPHLTLVLSTRFCQLATHPISRHVIAQCLNSFGASENQPLYEKAIIHFKELATHKDGCLSLNECIDNITGPMRETLLNCVALESSYLANDPLGNYVVQHVLGLENSRITDRICGRLRGQYAQLAMKKGGSHVVERCIKYSRQGMNYAVEEFLASEKTLVQLAKDNYGNYAIQSALRASRDSNSEIFRRLVKGLRENMAEISRRSNGRYVADILSRNYTTDDNTNKLWPSKLD